MNNAEAVKFLEESQDAFLQAVEGVDQATSQMQPAPGEWSVGEIIHHHILIEHTVRLLVRGLRWRLMGEKANAGDHKPAALEKVSQRVGRVKAMRRFIPAHGQALRQLLQRLRDERRKTLRLARRINLSKLRQRAFRHYILGSMNGQEWLLFIGHHQERHRRQIEEILQKLGMNVNVPEQTET
ncbi:MAG: DinB family protein [bacterium]